MNKIVINILLLIGTGLILKKLLQSKKVIVKGSYTVPQNINNRLDALHSFESRKIDGFGGRMSTKINEQLRKMYLNGINPDIESIKINIDPIKYAVQWEATLIPSKNGIAYVGLITRGSAGANADERAKNQLKDIQQKNATLVLDFNFNKGLKIRQFFYKYSLDNYPNL